MLIIMIIMIRMRMGMPPTGPEKASHAIETYDRHFARRGKANNMAYRVTSGLGRALAVGVPSVAFVLLVVVVVKEVEVS